MVSTVAAAWTRMVIIMRFAGVSYITTAVGIATAAIIIEVS